MNKEQELRLVQEVYHPSHELQFVPHERPDFLAKRNDLTALGIEVTELFVDDTEARLQRIPDYPTSLLEGADFRHKDDRRLLRVQQVTYQRPATGESTDIMAISRRTPSMGDRLGRLDQCVAEKLTKVSDYLSNCGEIDLIINDASDAFRFDQPDEFLRPFFRSAARRAIINGQFREVFLLTKRQGGDRVCVPLRANAFVADVMLLEQLVKDSSSSEPLDTRSALAIVTAALASVGYGTATMRATDDLVTYSFASIDYAYTTSGTHVTERTFDSEAGSSGNTLQEISMQLEDEFGTKVDEALAKRAGHTLCVDLLYEAHIDKPD